MLKTKKKILITFCKIGKQKNELIWEKVEIDFDVIKDLGNILRQKLHEVEEGIYLKNKYDSWVEK